MNWKGVDEMKRTEHTYFYGGQAMHFIGRLTPFVKRSINELKNYVDSGLYNQNREQLQMIIDKGIIDLRQTETGNAVNFLLAEYKKIIDAIQTDLEIQTDQLNELKRKALVEIRSLDDATRHNEPEKSLMSTYIHNARQEVNQSKNPAQIEDAVTKVTNLIVSLPQKEYKDRIMFLNTPTFSFVDIANGEDPDLQTNESSFRLIQLYENHFSGATYPGTDAPRPSLKLYTMDKEEVK